MSEPDRARCCRTPQTPKRWDLGSTLAIRRVTPAEIRSLNAIDMSYASTFGYRLRYEPQANPERTLPGWRVALSPHRFDPPFERTYEWDWTEVEGFDERVEAGDVWAAFLEGVPVGLLELRRSEWNRALWVQSLYVDSAHRRRGVGSLLLGAAIAEAERSAVRALFVETQVSNGPAINFYLKHGFSLCGFNDHLYTNTDLRHDEVALFLVREIESAP